MKTLRAELARAKEQAMNSDAAALKAVEELRAEQAAHCQSKEKIAKMAVELKDAAVHYQLLEKESRAKAALQPPLERPHHYSWLVPWLGQVPPEGSPRRQLHLQSQHITDTSIMLLLICVDHRRIHTMCLVKPLVYKHDVGSAASSCRFSSANSPVRLATESSAAYT